MQLLIGALLNTRIYVYGIGIVMIFLVALFVFWREIQRTPLNEEKIFDFLFVSLVFGLFLSRIFFVLYHASLFRPFLLRILLPLTYPGFDVVGFVIGFFSSLYVLCVRNKVDFTLLTRHVVFPLFLIRILIDVLSFALTLQISFVPEALLLVLFMWVLTFIQTAIKEERFPPEGVFFYFCSSFIFTSYIVDFFRIDRVYFLGQKLISVEQVLMVLAILFTFKWWIPFLFSNKK